MKTILIPTDFSKNALHALEYAQELFKCERACFFVLHAYAEEVYGQYKTAEKEDIEKLKQDKKEETEKKMDQLLDTVIGEPPNPLHNFETVACFDNLVDGVNNFVDEMNIDLVIMGTKGETSKFKSKVHCLYITDFDELSPRQEDNRLFLEETLTKPYLFFETTPVKNKAEVIVEQVEKKEAGMLVMMNSRHSFFEDMLYRSTVDLLGLKIKIPFMVMQNLNR